MNGSFDTSIGLAELQIILFPVSVFHGPAGALKRDLALFIFLEPDIASGAHAAGNINEEGIHQIFKLLLYVFFIEIAPQCTDAAVYIVSGSPGRNNASLQINSYHSADGQPVTIMDVRHGQRRFYDAGEAGAVSHLLRRVILGNIF